MGSLFSETFGKNATDPFETVVRQIAVGSFTTARLAFDHHQPSDQFGIILDDISLSLEDGAQPVPEPSAFLLLATGAAGLVGFRRRKAA